MTSTNLDMEILGNRDLHKEIVEAYETGSSDPRRETDIDRVLAAVKAGICEQKDAGALFQHISTPSRDCSTGREHCERTLGGKTSRTPQENTAKFSARHVFEDNEASGCFSNSKHTGIRAYRRDEEKHKKRERRRRNRSLHPH